MGFERITRFERNPGRRRAENWSDASELLERLPAVAAQPAPVPAITILLSTFNGEKYLPSQLESFLQQVHVDWRLAWRDDGSGDGTVEIMREFASRAGFGRCVESASSGAHLGAALSFLSLLEENQDAPFIAFADQDDRWLPTKLARSLRLLGDPGDIPALYCARQWLTDEGFNAPTPSMKFMGEPCFPASLTQNAATGNTVVLNRAAARRICAIPAPEAANHDWWSYIVVSACGGVVVYDALPSMLYRQHAKNMIGSRLRTASRALGALQRGRGIYMTMMRRHAERLWEYRDLLDRRSVADLQRIREGLEGGALARVSALQCRSFRRATALENLLFRLWFLTA